MEHSLLASQLPYPTSPYKQGDRIRMQLPNLDVAICEVIYIESKYGMHPMVDSCDKCLLFGKHETEMDCIKAFREGIVKFARLHRVIK